MDEVDSLLLRFDDGSRAPCSTAVADGAAADRDDGLLFR